MTQTAVLVMHQLEPYSQLYSRVDSLPTCTQSFKPPKPFNPHLSIRHHMQTCPPSPSPYLPTSLPPYPPTNSIKSHPTNLPKIPINPNTKIETSQPLGPCPHISRFAPNQKKSHRSRPGGPRTTHSFGKLRALVASIWRDGPFLNGSLQGVCEIVLWSKS